MSSVAVWQQRSLCLSVSVRSSGYHLARRPYFPSRKPFFLFSVAAAMQWHRNCRAGPGTQQPARSPIKAPFERSFSLNYGIISLLFLSFSLRSANRNLNRSRCLSARRPACLYGPGVTANFLIIKDHFDWLQTFSLTNG